MKRMPMCAADLTDVRVALVGKFGGLNRREAGRLVRSYGGSVSDQASLTADSVDWIVLGSDDFPWGEDDDQILAASMRQAAAEGKVEVLSETQFWQRLGLIDVEHNVRKLYTPAMLADLLQVPVTIIRRWHRRGLIVPARVVQRLPYFDFHEVATARRLAQLLAAGASPVAIEKRLEELARLVPDVERPLAQLSVIVEGKQLLLRQGEGLIEAGGQLRLNFECGEPELQEADAILSLRDVLDARASQSSPGAVPEVEQLERQAMKLEDMGRLQEAAEYYRAVLAAGGPRADICFHLAELLYRQGDISAARERYFIAIELDEEFVEARANLGCVLAELGQLQLAAAAFRGALACHPDYPDAHFHLARLLDDLDEPEEAAAHWERFLELAPDSPWAEEAESRLHLHTS